MKAIDDGRQITPAGEWLIDNFHLVERQIRQITTDLPPGYYRQLPKLVTGPFTGYPRVFGMAWAFVAHTDSCFDSDILVSYVKAYQEVQPLTIGELWAVSITLQIVLIENLRRLAQQITSSRTARHEADRLADRLLGVNGRASEPASIVFAGHGAQPLSEAFAVELVHRLRDQDPKFTPALAWLDERLAKQGLTADSAVREVHRSQGAANVTVRNIVTSLRVIAEVDWQVLFERYCLVDDVLASGCAFNDMDFATRNLYRSAVEDLARRSDHDELDIARLAVAAAHATDPSCEPPEQLRRSDPGYHLLAGGRRDFEGSIGICGFRGWPARVTARLNFDAYITAIVVASAIVLAAPLIGLARLGLGPVQLTILAVLGAICAIDAGVALVNRGVTRFVRPVPLPGLELRSGVPEFVAHPRRRADALDHARRHRGAGGAARDPPSGEFQKAICTSLCYPIGSTRTSIGPKAMRNWSLLRATALNASIDAMAPRPRARASSCCTVGEFGTTVRGAGSAGSANAASSIIEPALARGH